MRSRVEKSYRDVLVVGELVVVDGVVEVVLWPGVWPVAGLFCSKVKVKPPSAPHMPGTGVPFTSRA